MSANPQIPPAARQTRREQELMEEHVLWVSRALQCAPQPSRDDLGLLLKALQAAATEKKSLTQIQREEIMDVLRRTGEDGQGLDPLSMIRAARSLTSCDPAANDACAPQGATGADPTVLLETIKALEKHNRELVARMQSAAQPPPSPAPNHQPPLRISLPAPQLPQRRSSWLQRLLRLLSKKRPDPVPSVFAANGMRMDDLKTIVLTVHGQAQGRSLYEITADWSAEKLRARRVLRDWSAGNVQGRLVQHGATQCGLGVWLTQVEPPPALSRFVDDLRMWHSHWHAMADEGSGLQSDGDKTAFARKCMTQGGADQEWALCSRRIDRLLMEIAQAAQSAQAQGHLS